jgi:hypothetical protein
LIGLGRGTDDGEDDKDLGDDGSIPMLDETEGAVDKASKMEEVDHDKVGGPQRVTGKSKVAQPRDILDVRGVEW